MTEVTCKTCKHAFRNLTSLPIWGSGVEWKCHREWVEEHSEFDPIIGTKTIPGHYMRCTNARAGYRDAPCGKEGRNWQPREKRDFFFYLKRA
jgi:hypothetical protein